MASPNSAGDCPGCGTVGIGGIAGTTTLGAGVGWAGALGAERWAVKGAANVATAASAARERNTVGILGATSARCGYHGSHGEPGEEDEYRKCTDEGK